MGKNSFTCEMYFGSPGCGKTTYAVKLLRKSRKHRYASFDVRELDVCRLPDNWRDTLGKEYVPQSNSIIAIDEIGVDLNNRQYKSLNKELIEFLKYHRHYKCHICAFSQSWEDADITFRRLVDNLYYMRRSRLIPELTIIRKIKKEVTVDEVTQQIIDGYRFVFWLVPGAVRLCWRPRYYRYFDSFSVRRSLPELLSNIGGRLEFAPSSRVFTDINTDE